MWAIMMRFGYHSLPDELNGPNIHRLENVMTLEPSFRACFNNLHVWFVETDEVNRYKLESRYRILIKEYPEYVKFTSTNKNLLLPSPTYLRIHAACAKVAHLSGAGEYIDKLYQDLEDSKVLNPNGSSSETLEHALFQKLH
ncbi:hypothetical protein D9756_007009 [Leucocoprinus leucothites]|uniref:HNH nuclease domain-containing protein n=1 Tax=Leucocoprinus leucothites TaxID=201217 RepID=A0A8H5FZ95_9AGAR|nr:hypothetical protein D9756_007009 [Leucoagaricus leucothites]